MSIKQSTYDTYFSPERHRDQISGSPFFPVAKRASSQDTEGSPWLQKGSASPWLKHGESNDILANKDALTEGVLPHLNTPEGIVELNREGIKVALDRRVALFFQQCILCYKMPFTFSTKGADDQIGRAKELKFSSKTGKDPVVHKREAAHSSTLPTLLATPKDGRDKTPFVYLKGGSSHAQHNATIGMHRDVNGADELLDGKGNKGLRGTAIKILNRVADGLDPVRATKEFLKEFGNAATNASQPLEPTDLRRAVLESYVEGIQKIAQHVALNPQLFDRLIGVQINPNDPKEQILRKTIYQRRYDIIRLEEVIESRVGKLIADAKETVGPYVEMLLVKEFAETDQREIVEKLFAKTAEVFKPGYQKKLPDKANRNYKSYMTILKNLQKKHSALLQNLKKDLEDDFKKLVSSEWAYRAQVFKDLRATVRNWTQEKFREEYLATTGKIVSQAWVSRMEQPSRVGRKSEYKTPLNQRMRKVSLEDAANCADTFGIDVGLFLPCLITS